MKKLKQELWLVFSLCCALLLCGGVLHGQANTADIVGTVTDSGGAVLPNASVSLTNVATNVTQTAVSNGAGDYTFPLLSPGTYTVKVTVPGFKTFTAANVTVAVSDRARVDAKMQIGQATENVEVTDIAPALQTDSSSLGTLVTSQAIEDVPLDGRNFINLVQLSAGVSVGPQNDLTSGNRPDDRRQSSEFTVNGQGTGINNHLIDGMDNNERSIGTIGVRPSVDAIQEVNVQTNLYDASVGRTAGAVVDVITKSGSNRFHGSAYEFFRNAVLNANPNYGFSAPAAPKPAFRQNQYGASLGGPIKKDKLFFFGDFERFGNALGLPVTDTVPTLCQRGTMMVAAQAAAQKVSVPSFTCPDGTTPTTPGDFSEVQAISILGGSPTRPAFGSGPNIPASALDQIGTAMFSLYPLPTGSGLSSNYEASPLRTQNTKTYDIRIDANPGNSNSFFVRYSFNDSLTLTPGDFPKATVQKNDPFWTGTSDPISVYPNSGNGTFAGSSKQRAQDIALSWNHVFRPNVVGSFQFGFLRYAVQSLNINPDSNASNALGITCNSVDCINYGSDAAAGLVQIAFIGSSPYNNQFCYFFCNGDPTIGGYQFLGDEEYIPLKTFDNTFREAGTITWTKNAHSVKFGAALIRRQLSIAQSQDAFGTYNISGIYTGTQGGDLLEGLSSSVFRTAYLVTPAYRAWEPGLFVQDDYHIKHWLTLNMGVRYDIFTPFSETLGRISNWNPTTGLVDGPSIPGAQQSGPRALVHTSYGDIAPRLGFAASLRHNFVLRGGYGLTYFPAIGGSGQSLRNQPFGYSFQCSQQVQSGLNTACPADLGSNALAQYGSQCPGANCPVGLSGGNAFAAGAPVPFLDVNQVFVPANCTVASCPNNPYASGVPQAVWPSARDGVLQSFNLQMQKEFSGNVVTIGYVGELGRHINTSYNPNQLSNYTQTATPLAAQFPWLAGTGAAIQETDLPIGTNSYHGLQSTFVRRFRNGLTAQVNYTWSHALTNGSIFATSGTIVCQPTVSDSLLGYGNGPQYVNPCFFDNYKNPTSPIVVNSLSGGPFGVNTSAYDVRNRLAGTFNYQLPFGHSAHGAEGALIKGWGVNGSFSVQSGDPYTLTTGLGAGFGGVRPDQVCSGRSGSKSLANWGVNVACFKQPTNNTFGTERLDQLTGPWHKNINFSIFKEFPLPESVRLQFRTEIFNLFNTPNFSAPSQTSINQYDNNGFGVQPASGSLVGAVTSLNNNYNAREIQFAVKFLF
jgi:hypothetical protein